MFQNANLISPKIRQAYSIKNVKQSPTKSGTEENRVENFYLSGLTVQENSPFEEWGYIFDSTATISKTIILSIQEQFRTLFENAKYSIFEDGVETDFSRQLMYWVAPYNEAAIATLDNLIIGDQVNMEVAAEALRWIGKINNPDSKLSRRRFLEKCLLKCRYGRVRDGALLGLASMDDPASIDIVRKAIEQEVIPELKDDLKQLFSQLIETKAEQRR